MAMRTLAAALVVACLLWIPENTHASSMLAQGAFILGAPLLRELKKHVAKIAISRASKKAGDALEMGYYEKLMGRTVDSMYDVNIDMDSLQQISQPHGWPILFSDESKVDKFGSRQTGLVVAFMGVYNRGKTFIMNKVGGHKLPSGLLTHTSGVSVMLPRGKEHIMYIDSAGTDQPVEYRQMEDRLASQAFLQHLLIDISHINVFVVNALTLKDQSYIQDVVRHLKEVAEKSGKLENDIGRQLILVHNYKSLSRVEDVQEKIKKDLELCARSVLVEQNVDGKASTFWKEKRTAIRHIVFAQDGTPAGNKFNEMGVRLLQSWFAAAVSEKEFDGEDSVINRITDFATKKLPLYFQLPEGYTPKIVVDITPHPRLTLALSQALNYKEGLDFDHGFVVAPSKDQFVPKVDVRSHPKEHRTVVMFDIPAVLPGSMDGSVICKQRQSKYRCVSSGFNITVSLMSKGKKAPYVKYTGSRAREFEGYTEVGIDRRGYGIFDGEVSLDENIHYMNPRSTWGDGVFIIHLEQDVEDDDDDFFKDDDDSSEKEL